MDRSTDQSAAPVGHTLEYELSLVREAIAMVAGRSSPRVVVGGLRFGEHLLTTARGFATEAGVGLVPLWIPDHAGADIAIERLPDDHG